MSKLIKPILKDVLTALDKAEDSKKLPPICSLKKLEKDLSKAISRRLHNRALKIMFKNYFSGRGVFKGVECLDHQKDYLLEDFEEYLTLYKFLCFGWEEICNEFKDTVMPANTPGEALAYILADKERSSWESRDNLANPKALYLAWNQNQKCKKLASQNIPYASEKEKLYRLMKRLGIYPKPPNKSEADIFLSLCLQTCMSSKNKYIKKSAQEYKEKWFENQTLTVKRLRANNFKLNST